MNYHMQDVTQELGMKAMPTFILIKKGKEVDKLVGAKKMISKRILRNIESDTDQSERIRTW